MPSWFDLMSLDPNGPEDEPGIRKAVAYVEKLIDDEISQGVPSERIVLGGFSQGGALAMFTALTTKHKLGGLVALSCWFPLHKTLLSEGGTLNSDLPVLQCHGDCDPIVPYKWGQMTSTMLKKLLSKYDFKTYKSLGHSSHPLEMEDVQTFVNERIGDM
jgi:lysophospholipase-2